LIPKNNHHRAVHSSNDGGMSAVAHANQCPTNLEAQYHDLPANHLVRMRQSAYQELVPIRIRVKETGFPLLA